MVRRSKSRSADRLWAQRLLLPLAAGLLLGCGAAASLEQTALDPLAGAFHPAPAPTGPGARQGVSWNRAALEEISRLSPRGGVRFVLIGDTVTRRNRKFAEMMKQILALRPSPHFIVHLGDFAYHKDRHYDSYLAILRTCGIPYLQVKGNHDVTRSDRFAEVFGPSDFHFDVGEMRFIVLDNVPDRGRDSYGFSAAQLAWLESLLGEKETCVFAHAPPTLPLNRYTVNPYLNAIPTLENQARFLRLIEQHRVKLAAFGHHHLFTAMKPGEVRYVITGGGGQPNLLSWLGLWRTWITSRDHFLVVDHDPLGTRGTIVFRDTGLGPAGGFDDRSHRYAGEFQQKVK